MGLSCPQIPAETRLEWGTEVTKGAGGDRDSSSLELEGVFIAQSPLPLLARGCLQLPRIAVAMGEFSAFEFCKTILRKISPRRCWLSSRLEIAFPLLEIPPGVSDGECTTSLSILRLLSHILITRAGLHPSRGSVPGFWSSCG